MYRLISQTILFCSISFLLYLIILTNADGHTDPFYLRFTSSKQTNLILGTSRAAQGIQPTILDSILNVPFYNYSFTIEHSPFGEIYLNSIKNKIDKNTKDGIYILSVNPWSISSRGNLPNDLGQFRENSGFLAHVKSVNQNPNLYYILRELKGKYYSVLFKSLSSMFVHDNGWLEVSINMDSLSMNSRINAKIDSYADLASQYKYSQLRYEYLIKTIKYLKKNGDVYIVRLPVHNKMLDIENDFMPDFDDKIKKIKPLIDGYYNMTSDNYIYRYTDGNHLFKNSGKLVTIKIAKWIKLQQINN